MKNHKPVTVLSALLIAALLLSMGGCGRDDRAASPAAPAGSTDPAGTGEGEVSSETGQVTSRRDGERFEGTIMIEGMEETVRYEHVRNDVIGFEMDYDYENFVRHSESDRESFVSCWDDPEHPENYLEVRFSPQNAETAAAAVGGELSRDYDIYRDDSLFLDRAGACIHIDASADIGGLTMPERLQAVYIVPAPDGCRVVRAHYSIEGAEGFGRRFRCLMDTFSAIPGRNLPSIAGTWQTASVGYGSDGTMSPEYDVRFTAAEVVYGHMKDGQFVPDHSDKIIFIDETAAGAYKVQAAASNGTLYTLKTSESDADILEYYETWREEDFAEMYRGGASLSRNG